MAGSALVQIPALDGNGMRAALCGHKDCVHGGGSEGGAGRETSVATLGALALRHKRPEKFGPFYSGLLFSLGSAH